MKIEKVTFTGTTLTSRKIMEGAVRSNLKNITLELDGKVPPSLMMPIWTRPSSGLLMGSYYSWLSI